MIPMINQATITKTGKMIIRKYANKSNKFSKSRVVNIISDSMGGIQSTNHY